MRYLFSEKPYNKRTEREKKVTLRKAKASLFLERRLKTNFDMTFFVWYEFENDISMTHCAIERICMQMSSDACENIVCTDSEDVKFGVCKFCHFHAYQMILVRFAWHWRAIVNNRKCSRPVAIHTIHSTVRKSHIHTTHDNIFCVSHIVSEKIQK